MNFNIHHNNITSHVEFSSLSADRTEIPHAINQIFPVTAGDTRTSSGGSYHSSETDNNFYSPNYFDEEMENAPPLMMTHSHAQSLNAELDALDAEIMGDENIKILRANSYFPEDFEQIEYRYYDGEDYYSEEYSHHNETEVGNRPSEQFSGNFNNQPPKSQQQNQRQDIREGDNPPASIADQTQSLWNTYQHGISGMIELFDEEESSGTHRGPRSPPNHLPEAGSPSDSLVAPINLTPAVNAWQIEDAGIPVATTTVDIYQAALLYPSSPFYPEIHLPSPEIEGDDQTNLDLYGTLRHWGHEASYFESKRSKCSRGPSLPAVEAFRLAKPDNIKRSELRGDECDIQKINWKELGISRLEARRRRSQIYFNYTNIRYPAPLNLRLSSHRLQNSENYFRFRRMDFKHEINMLHFQLRNLIACPTRDHVFYCGRSKILHRTPAFGDKDLEPSVALDLSSPTRSSQYSMTQGIQITTMAVGHNVLIAGGFHGEYGLVNLLSEKGTKHTEGLISEKQNSIINHIQIYSTRGNAHPEAAFASNNTSLRLLDIATNKVTAEHFYDYPINCSAISPDHRLRVMVGDMLQVLICNAETGAQLQALEGHYDFGFACDWADDGWTVATGNQDRQIMIWDARKWTTSSGAACPIATVYTEMTGVRKLKFSPLGSGKRLLFAAEPVDYISVIDAERFTSKQTLSFFGEISGFDFTNDGQDLFVANSDICRGGIMEFERSNLAGYGRYDLESVTRTRNLAGICDWMSEKDVVRHHNSEATLESLERRAASLGVGMGFF